MLSETSDISRVLFPADYNSAAETLARLYQTQGQIWTLVIPKRTMPVLFSEEESQKLLNDGGIQIKSAQGLKRHLLGEFRIGTDLQKSMVLTQFSVLFHIAACLPHEPDWRTVDCFSSASLQKTR